MSIGGYKIRDQSLPHFVTFATVEWVDVFTRKQYRDILPDSLRYLQQEKGWVLHAWCIMPNHVHLVERAGEENLSDLLRDVRKFTSRQLIVAIQNNDTESRKDWMLIIFRKAGEINSRNKTYQFWRQDNGPKELYSPAFMAQKIDYVHYNSVVAGWVERPEHYLYSNARDYLTDKLGMLPVVAL
jgi:putative transposase